MAASKDETARRAWQIFMNLHEGQHAVFAKESERLGLSQASAAALSALLDLPTGPIGQLATRLGVDPGWVTDLVDKLEEFGAVRRRESPEDRRVRVVELTPIGRRVATELRDTSLMPPSELSALADAQLKALLRIAEELDRIRAKARSANADARSQLAKRMSRVEDRLHRRMQDQLKGQLDRGMRGGRRERT